MDDWDDEDIEDDEYIDEDIDVGEVVMDDDEDGEMFGLDYANIQGAEELVIDEGTVSSYLRSSYQIALDKVKGIIFTDINYSQFDNKTKSQAFNLCTELPKQKVERMNPKVLSSALVYVARFRFALKRNIKMYLKMTNGLKNINHLDLLRYIRSIEK